jgi:hypothetical protein
MWRKSDCKNASLRSIGTGVEAFELEIVIRASAPACAVEQLTSRSGGYIDMLRKTHISEAESGQEGTAVRESWTMLLIHIGVATLKFTVTGIKCFNERGS